ncbi:MAG: ferrous iron transport protein A [Candidatus Omnitrophica bacterium]|jgi:Fe2+ transport system protein FeoA|nr:ferrous iron transport protein A [Candidatus Omnitrophota bacterium]
MKKITLVQLKEKHKGVILDIPQGAVLQNKLMSMGIYKGREVTKISYIGLKGPVAIKVGRSVMVLGYGMANKIIVETQ